MKLSADARDRIYLTWLGGSDVDGVSGLAVTSDGSAFVTGITRSEDFSTTAGAYEPDFGSGNTKGYVVRLDPDGGIVYLTYLGRDVEFARPFGIAVNGAGEAFVTGTYNSGDFPLTAGALSGPGPGGFQTFVVRLNAAGTEAIYSLTGHGGGRIAVDSFDNAVVTGNAGSPSFVKTTEGSFEPNPPAPVACSATKAIVFPCPFQYVQKIDPTGTRLLFGTFLAGSFGSRNAAVTVDAAGDIYVAGSTISPDYPTTEGAFQRVNNVPYLPEPIPSPLFGFSLTQPTNGFVSKLSSDGSRLLFSTYLGGSEYDSIDDLDLLPDGGVVVVGGTRSADAPGLPAMPTLCGPGTGQGRAFATRLTADGSSVSAATLLPGSGRAVAALADAKAMVVGTVPRMEVAVSPETFTVQPALERTDGGVYMARVRFDREARETELSCLRDSATLAPLGPIAPGHLLSLFGTNLTTSEPVIGQPDVDGLLPRALAGIRVTFDGLEAPLLYVSRELVNVGAPFELAGQEFTQLELEIAGEVIASRRLRVVPSSPSLFMNQGALVQVCGGIEDYGPLALVLNEDGRQNSCAASAAGGSVVTLFINGTGVAAGVPPTLEAELASRHPDYRFDPLEIVSVEPLPARIDGVWRARVRLPVGADPSESFFLLELDGIPVHAGGQALFPTFRIAFEVPR